MTSEHIPLPDLSLHVLLALAEGDRHGWGVIKRIEELTDRRESPSSGSLYLAMSRLEKAGLIENAPPPDEGADARRKYYRLTDRGRSVLAREVDRLSGLVEWARSAGVTGAG